MTVLQEMLALAQTPPSLVFLLTEKLLSLIPDDQRRIQTVGAVLLTVLTALLPSSISALARLFQVAEIISDVREPITEPSQPLDQNQSRRQQVQVAMHTFHSSSSHDAPVMQLVWIWKCVTVCLVSII